MRILRQSGGPNINTWLVGHVPIGHYQHNFAGTVKLPSGLMEQGAKTFFLKARMMAGQVNLKENKLGHKDFKWLAKDELEKKVEHSYWKSVKNIRHERTWETCVER